MTECGRSPTEPETELDRMTADFAVRFLDAAFATRVVMSRKYDMTIDAAKATALAGVP